MVARSGNRIAGGIAPSERAGGVVLDQDMVYIETLLGIIVPALRFIDGLDGDDRIRPGGMERERIMLVLAVTRIAGQRHRVGLHGSAFPHRHHKPGRNEIAAPPPLHTEGKDKIFL